MKKKTEVVFARVGRVAFAVAIVAVWLSSAGVYAADVDGQRLINSDQEPGNWMTYHGTFKSWHYSPLDQINTGNVNRLTEAWSHVASRANRGLQGLPLAIDGVVYYSSPYNQVYALDGATGKSVWTYKHKLNEDLVARQTHSPYNRGIAAGYGSIYMGTLDGKLAAIDMKSGQLKWETKLIDSEKLTVGFTGAPLMVKDKVIIGAQGGEWPYRGPIFGVNAKTGEKVWEFFTVGGNEDNGDARNTWGKDSWRTGGGGGWMAGTYDPETNTVWWGTANPAPLYDWAGDKWMTDGPRPGINLYTTSIILMDPDTGKLKGYHQQLPHDAWDFDSAVGRIPVPRSRRKEVRCACQQGRLRVRLRPQRQSAERLERRGQYQLREGHRSHDGRAVGRRDMSAGKHTNLCPAIAGGYSWPTGAYSPKTGLYYRVGFEWCMDLRSPKPSPLPNHSRNSTSARTSPCTARARFHHADTFARAIRSPAK